MRSVTPQTSLRGSIRSEIRTQSRGRNTVLSPPPPRINQDSWGQGSLGNTEHSSDRGKHSELKNKYFKLLKLKPIRTSVHGGSKNVLMRIWIPFNIETNRWKIKFMQITGNRFNHFVQLSKFIFNVTCSINELGSDLDPDLDSCN